MTLRGLLALQTQRAEFRRLVEQLRKGEGLPALTGITEAARPFVIAALLVPGVALAKSNPDKGTHQNHGKAKVQYILKGQLSAFTAFDSSTSTNGMLS